MPRRKINAPTTRTPVTITRNGKTYSGEYAVAGSMITVTYGGKSKITQIGGSKGDPEPLARVMLSEMIP